MLKRILLIISLLLILSSASASAIQWIEVEKKTNPDYSIATTYFDMDNISKREDTATVWVKVVNNNGYGIAQKEYSRYYRAFIVLHYRFYYQDELIKEGSVESERIPITPGSYDEAIYDFLW